MHVPSVLLLFCHFVHLMPCLVLYPPYPDFKMPVVKNVCITGTNFTEKNPVYTLVMKIGNCPIPFPFQYRSSHLNDNLNYIPHEHKSINLLGTVAVAATKSTMKSSCLSLTIIVKLAALIIPSKLPTNLMTWS